MGSQLYRKRWGWEDGRGRKVRPKTFSSEESAKNWALKNKIVKYILENISISTKKKKIRVIAQ